MREIPMRTVEGDRFTIILHETLEEWNRNELASHDTVDKTVSFCQETVTPGLVAHEVFHLYFSLKFDDRSGNKSFDEEEIADFLCGVTDAVLKEIDPSYNQKEGEE